VAGGRDPSRSHLTGTIDFAPPHGDYAALEDRLQLRALPLTVGDILRHLFGEFMRVILVLLFCLLSAVPSKATEPMSFEEAFQTASELYEFHIGIGLLLGQLDELDVEDQKLSVRGFLLALLSASSKYQTTWLTDTTTARAASPKRFSQLDAFAPCLWLTNVMAEALFRGAKGNAWKHELEKSILAHEASCRSALNLAPKG